MDYNFERRMQLASHVGVLSGYIEAANLYFGNDDVFWARRAIALAMDEIAKFREDSKTDAVDPIKAA
jgi:hypothetical protein